jgi:hypothetical protein
MEPAGESGRIIRFGPFETEPEAGEPRLKVPTLKRRGCPFVASVAPVSSPAEAVAPLYERREESAVIDRRYSTRRVGLASAALIAIVVAPFASVAPLYERREESAVIDRRYSTRRAALAAAALVAIVVATFALNLAGFRGRVAAAGVGLARAPARPQGAPRRNIGSISVHSRQCLTAAL